MPFFTVIYTSRQTAVVEAENEEDVRTQLYEKLAKKSRDDIGNVPYIIDIEDSKEV